MKNLVIIFILLLLVIGSFFFLRSLQEELVPKVVEEKIQPVATGYQVKTRVYNSKNQLSYELVSDKIVEFSNQHGTEFSQPLIWLWDDKQQLNWKGKSQEAFLTGNHELLTMKKAVEIIQFPESAKPTYLNGDEISYNAKTSILDSQLPVKVDDGTNRQTSDKIQANTKTKKLSAKGHIKAHYESAALEMR